jgi:hypothetical protein
MHASHVSKSRHGAPGTCGQAKPAIDLDGTELPGNGTDEVNCPDPQAHINLLATGKTGKGFGRN